MTTRRQIIDFLLTCPDCQSYGKQIERATGLRHSTVSSELSNMKRQGIIVEVHGVSHERCGDVRLVRRSQPPPRTDTSEQMDLFR
jgi:DNA-binding MarR family transcriptional regulator